MYVPWLGIRRLYAEGRCNGFYTSPTVNTWLMNIVRRCRDPVKMTCFALVTRGASSIDPSGIVDINDIRVYYRTETMGVIDLPLPEEEALPVAE